MAADRLLREQVIGLLRGGNAHMDFDTAIAGFPEARINVRPANVGYTFWHLIEHLRLTQLDILDYVTSAAYRERAWPLEYWPDPGALATNEDWDRSVAAFGRDLEQLIAIVDDEATDLFATVPSSDEHTILREMLIVADHNSYHIGELGILRQIEDAWGEAGAGSS